jgi:hypothetical protein
MSDNYFTTLYDVDVSDKVEKKNSLSYLSWAWAWAELKKIHPDATSKVYENSEGWNYFTDGKTAWVKTGVTVKGLEHIEYLYVMDNRNQSLPLSAITSKDINKTIQRSITKAIGRHGLGLRIYAGEDLPEDQNNAPPPPPPQQPKLSPKEIKDRKRCLTAKDYLGYTIDQLNEEMTRLKTYAAVADHLEKLVKERAAVESAADEGFGTKAEQVAQLFGGEVQ